jgi:hypothetical protein
MEPVLGVRWAVLVIFRVAGAVEVGEATADHGTSDKRQPYFGRVNQLSVQRDGRWGKANKPGARYETPTPVVEKP